MLDAWLRRPFGSRILDLSACRGIGVSSLQDALPQLKQLEVLHLDGNPEASPARHLDVLLQLVLLLS